MLKMLTYTNPPIHLIESKDYGSAGVDSESINLGIAQRVSMVFSFGAVTGNSILIPYAGASAGTKTTALAFRYRMSGGDFKAASSDQYGALTDVAATGLTLTAATFDHRVIEIYIESIDLPAGKPWLTVNIDSTATVMNVAAVAVPQPRYVSDVMPTAI